MSRFISGVPRDKHWIRMKATENIPLDRIKSAAEASGLEHKANEDGYVVVYGEKSKIQSFIKKIAEPGKE